MNLSLFSIQLILSSLFALLIPLLSPRPPTVLRQVWAHFGKLAQRRVVAFVAVTSLALALRAVMGFALPIPEPRIHDEFSYLLAADTFASGRLTNPPHQLWQFFESNHINQQPTYASMYPPAQGMVLAVGQLVTGRPWFGVWLSCGIMCGLLYWMLIAWLPPRWALLGGLLAVLHIGTVSYWMNSYWGGCVAAIGGLLVLGALPRILFHAQFRMMPLLALGLIVLANSRPYEGLLLVVSSIVTSLIVRLRKRPLQITRRFIVFGLVAVMLLLVAGATMGFYFWRVTGSPLVMPYQVNQRMYAMNYPFLWQTPRTNVQYRHDSMRQFHEWFLSENLRARSSITGFLDLLITKLSVAWLFYVGPILSISLLSFSKTIFDHRIRFFVLLSLFAIVGVGAETWFHPHYIAPFLGVIYVLMLQCMRHIRCWRLQQKRFGLWLVFVVPLLSTVIVALATFSPSKAAYEYWYWCYSEARGTDRSKILAYLRTKGDQHLVIVHYDPSHPINDNEWVYNRADIDSSAVVFAHDMGVTENRKLIDYFKNRRVWLLKPDDNPLTLTEYDSDSSSKP